MARCTQITNTGASCKERRLAWLWLVCEDGRLDYCCTGHLRNHHLHRVSASLLQEWMCRAATPSTEARDIALEMEVEMAAQKVEDIASRRPHEHGRVTCRNCGHPWIAVRPKGIQPLECPKCHQMTGSEAPRLAPHLPSFEELIAALQDCHDRLALHADGRNSDDEDALTLAHSVLNRATPSTESGE